MGESKETIVRLIHHGIDCQIIKSAENTFLCNTQNTCKESIGYSVDLTKAREVLGVILPAIQKKYPDLFPETPEYLGVQELGDSAVVLRVVAHVEENK